MRQFNRVACDLEQTPLAPSFDAMQAWLNVPSFAVFHDVSVVMLHARIFTLAQTLTAAKTLQPVTTQHAGVTA